MAARCYSCQFLAVAVLNSFWNGRFGLASNLWWSWFEVILESCWTCVGLVVDFFRLLLDWFLTGFGLRFDSFRTGFRLLWDHQHGLVLDLFGSYFGLVLQSFRTGGELF